MVLMELYGAGSYTREDFGHFIIPIRAFDDPRPVHLSDWFSTTEICSLFYSYGVGTRKGLFKCLRCMLESYRPRSLAASK